ncbi:MAG: S1 family peptidase [Kineosporiaceae bacterium]
MPNDHRPRPRPTARAVTPRRSVPALLALSAATVLTAGALAAVPASAAPAAAPAPAAIDRAAQDYLVATHGLSRAEAAEALAGQRAALATTESLESRLGDRLTGAVVDETTGALTVEVADAAAADVAEAAGAEARVDSAEDVESGAEALAAAMTELDAAGAAVSVDAAGDAVVLSVPAGDLDAATEALVAEAEALGVPVSIERTAGPVDTFALYGGEDILLNLNQGRCSAGFNLVSGSTYYLLTAGHCSGDTWYDDGVAIGTTVAESFPGDDYKLIQITNVSGVNPQGTVLYNSGTFDVSTAGSPPVGTTVCRTGSTTGTRCGTIQAYNATVTYQEGSVSGLVRTNVCAEPGDSGGPLFASGGVAVGITSGGNGNCTSGGTTYFQTVSEVTSGFGLSVL